MPEININVTSNALSINEHAWSSPMPTEQVCQAIGSYDLIDGDPMLFDGKPEAMFRYFDNLGIAILEDRLQSIVTRITIFMEVPSVKGKFLSSYGDSRAAQRTTERAFSGLLEFNGKQLRSPLRFTQFPLKGDFTFISRMAFGVRVEAHVGERNGFVESVSFNFKKGVGK